MHRHALRRPAREAGIAPSIGSVGVSFDNAMAESIIWLSKAKVINRRGRGDSLEQVEGETMRWVACFNHGNLFEAFGDIPPAELEADHYRQTNAGRDGQSHVQALRITRMPQLPQW